MAVFHPTIRRRPFAGEHRLTIVLLSAASVLALAFAPDLLNPESGLQSAEPIGPYLNGVFTADAPTPEGDSATYTVVNAFPNLTFNDPVKMLELPSGKFMVFGKSGYAWTFANDPQTSTKILALNINNRTQINADGGLLGAALHPEYGQAGSPNAGYFYVWYRYHPIGDPRGEQAFMRLSRFTMNAAETYVDPASEYVLVQQFDRQNWHNGGDMFFGPDGFLYFAVGDEGGANDQYNRTQNISSWFFGGVFRIDVDMRGGAISHPIRRQPINGATPPSGWPNSFSQGYYVPNDNPWQDPAGGILEEFWALGTRSPHRMTYDPPTGDIWIGDVGQGSREEISRVFVGANLQWPYREGNINGPKAKPNPLIGYDQLPVYSYPRSFGQCVIGGYVVRGNKYPELEGKYIFSDHETQNIHTLELSALGTAQNVQFLLNVPAEGSGGKDGISSFSMTSDGTLYILDLYGTNLDGGKVRKLVRIQHGVPAPPTMLSQLGVFTDMATLETAPGIIPFTVNSPLWSDRAEKKRWMAIPNDGFHDSPAERIGFNPDDKWTFPPGTVMIKYFELPLNENDPTQTARLETRFMIYKNSGEAYGLTYRWNASGTDAYLIEGEEIGDFTITRADGSTFEQTWNYPGRQQCMTCHTAASGYALGLKAHQLNGDQFYASTGVTANQLVTLSHLGLFDQAIPDVDDLRRARPLDDLTASAEERVMAYLDANCSSCHRPNGVVGAFDARFATPLAQKGLVYQPTIGMNSPMGQLVVEPGDTLGSEIWVRDARPNAVPNSMPPMGKEIVHEAYMRVLTEWIMTLDPVNYAEERTSVHIKVLLQGPYENGTMSDGLRSTGLVPTNDPYPGLAMHAGSNAITYPHTLSGNGERKVVDWVLVELRDAQNPSTVLETEAALLLNDGTVIDPQGGPLRYPNTTGSRYVAVRHRNHLGVMIASPIDLSNGPAVVDFTDPTTPVYGTEAMATLSNGSKALWTGDVNGDGRIQYTGIANDRDRLLTVVGGSVPTATIGGYLLEDLDLDGTVRYTGTNNDRDRILQNIGGTVPTRIRVEQLP